MSAKHQKFKISIPGAYTDDEREAIATEIMDHIRERTQDKHVDKDGNKFPSYSKSYANSLNFKNAGKSKGSVDLTLSGDMLAAMKLLQSQRGKIVIGYEAGSIENAKADGNIRGTYGQDKGDPKKARDFLGISKKELSDILKKYPVENTKARRKAVLESKAAEAAADRAIGSVEVDDAGGE